MLAVPYTTSARPPMTDAAGILYFGAGYGVTSRTRQYDCSRLENRVSPQTRVHRVRSGDQERVDLRDGVFSQASLPG